MTEYKSPYKRGADDGAWFGLYLTALFFTTVLSTHFGFLSLVSLILIVGVPVVVYYSLRRTYIQESLTTTLSSLWMQGIMQFLCGSMIAAVFAVVYMKWVNPTYLVDMVVNSIDVYRQFGSPDFDKMADGLQLMVDAGAVPSPISFVIAMIWTGTLTGSILSLILGLIVRAANSPSRARKQYPGNKNA